MRITQLASARNNTLTAQMKKIARDEHMSPTLLLKRIRQGLIVVPCNNTRTLAAPCGIGCGLRTKVNANIGTSTEHPDIREEIQKLAIAIKAGADAVMDLSVGGDLARTRTEIIKHAGVPVGTVPVYEMASRALNKKGSMLDFDAQDMLACLHEQASQGVDFFTIHSGITKKSIAAVKKSKRLMPIVSRGGAILANWVITRKKENPF